MAHRLCYSFLVPDASTFLLPTCNDAVKWNALHASVERSEVVKAFDFFREHSLEPILIKGWAATRYYPTDIPRYSTDIDLAFSNSDFARANSLLSRTERRGLPLDLHNELRHLDPLLWTDLFDRSMLVDLDGVQVRVLSDEDHLRVLCVHWLTDGGANKDRLWDIYYAVDRRQKDFDWSSCLDVVSEDRRRWVIYTIGLAHRYLDLKIDDLPFADDAKELPKWILNTVEREWASNIRLQPLLMFTDQPKMLWQQILKRMPPNPIHSTVDVEGSFDSRFRLHYQVKSIVKRSFPMIKKIIVSLKANNS